MNSFRLYMLGLLVLFGGYVALEYYRPKPLDWRPTLSNKDKIPYGTYALYDVLPQLLATDSVESMRRPIYSQLYDEDEPELAADSLETVTTYSSDEATTDSTSRATTDSARVATGPSPVDTAATAKNPDASESPDTTEATDATDSTALVTQPASAADSTASDDNYEESDETTAAWARGTYVFISPEFLASRADADALLAYVASGHDVFIAANTFGTGGLRRQHSLTDSLGVTLTDIPFARNSLLGTDSVQLRFANPHLAGVGLRLPPSAVAGYFKIRAGQAGATLATDAAGHAVLVRLDHGQGHFYLSSTPLAFSNFYVLNPRSQAFALAALSYLPAGRPVWWDEYQKQGRVGDQSVLRVLMAHESLRTAYYLLWVTVLLFLFVEARRRQRIIPVLKPLPNTTLLFTRTVASLYQQGSNHSRIAEKKTTLFLDYLRSRFQEPTPDLGDEDFRERLSQKSGVARPRIDELVRFINFARTAPAVSDRELLVLSKAIRDFKRESR